MRKALAILGFAILILAVSALQFHKHSERQAEKQRNSFCEMFELAKALESDLSSVGELPDQLSGSTSVLALNGTQPCVGEMQLVDGNFLDPWGRPYSYQIIDNSSAILEDSLGKKIFIGLGEVQILL